MDANPLALLIFVTAVILLVAALAARRHRSNRLIRQFGPEYHRAVETLGSPAKAEAELEARRRRVDKLHLVPLAPGEAGRFRESWFRLQESFVDDPHGVVRDADRLVCELMRRCGYPMGEFDQRAADVSVDHPRVVSHYRAAHELALADSDGRADTESLRQALVHYRELFAELLRSPAEPAQPERRREKPRAAWTERAMARKDAQSRDKPH
ncbi:MAG TPA: hypothetical protein VHA82_22625 [Ramlibacter sp.]|uniref:hypothetical protein n=1 Tax=Ramlibacter sp. TaxID=1917967 RepID=UPI002CE85F13|nr:hypothetical protein [Ramlibacter sp.]HVZ46618.1 hypothetical protein [Ramlibacter sp.]